MSLGWDPFEGDPLLSDALDQRPQPGAVEQRRLIELATTSIDGYFAARCVAIELPAHVVEPHGPRQRKRRQRRLLFDALRLGLGRTAACEQAVVTPATFSPWMEQPSFQQAVLRAERTDAPGAWDPDI